VDLGNRDEVFLITRGATGLGFTIATERVTGC